METIYQTELENLARDWAKQKKDRTLRIIAKYQSMYKKPERLIQITAAIILPLSALTHSFA